MEGIAIIGFSFQLPGGSQDEASLWKVLEEKRNLMTPWPKERVNIDAFYDPGGTQENMLSSKGGHFINEDLSAFDAPFFSITAKEAVAMDPQHRWSLETTYRAFENVGLPIEELKGSRTAVFAASMSDDYARMHAKDPDTAPRMVIVGTPPSLLANRISYHFNFTGPSVHIDTACSSSTIAVDLACQSLLVGDATLAVVTGANLLLGPEDSVLMSSLGFLSQDGVCYSFDHRATGYGRGEGIISVILKPISSAIRDGDMIRAVIRGTGSNQDGRTPVLPQPNAISQESLIHHVYRKAGLGLELTRYFEAHGTGTSVGDPIEARAIGRAFMAIRSSSEPLFVGSIKANIGHLEAASGLAAIIKTILVLEKGIIAPNALLEKESSFGFGGSNCHIIIDDAFHYLQSLGLRGNHRTMSILPAGSPTPALINNDWHRNRGGLLVWSAATESTLQEWMPQWEVYLDKSALSQKSLDCIAYTLAHRRSRMPWRTFAVLDASLFNQAEKRPRITQKLLRASIPTPLTFVFTGQGAQYCGMGIELLQFVAFKSCLKRFDAALKELGCKWSLFSTDEIRNATNINKPDYSQPLCTALQIALVELLKSFSIIPTLVLGHSSGEIAAAYTVGALSLESACKVSFLRGKLAASLKETDLGSMVAVNLSESKAKDYLQHLDLVNDVHVACVNSPLNVTLAGPEKLIDVLAAHLEADGVFVQKLNTGIAYHSPAMRGISNSYESMLGSLQLGETPAQVVSMISSVTGTQASNSELITPRYWVVNLESKVEFSKALQRSARIISKESGESGRRVSDVLEIGPHAALRRPIKEILDLGRGQKNPLTMNYIPALVKNRPSRQTMLELVGQLFCHGHDVRIPVGVAESSQGSNKALQLLTDCPMYPFDHSRKYWEESRLSRDYRLRSRKPNDLLGNCFYDWNPLQPRWRKIATLNSLPWLRDHEISGTIVYPATAMLAMAVQAVRETIPSGKQITGYIIKDAKFMSPIVVSDDLESKTETMLHLRPLRQSFEMDTTWFEIQIFCYSNNRWSEAFWAKIQVQFVEPSDDIDGGLEVRFTNQQLQDQYEEALNRCNIAIDRNEFYAYCRRHGHNYGSAFSLLKDIYWDGNEVTVGRIDATAVSHHLTDTVHPAILDAALHIFLVQSSAGLTQPTPTFVPSRVTNAWMAPSGWQYPETTGIRLSMQTYYKPNGGGLEGAAYAVDDHGRRLWMLPNVELFPISTANSPVQGAASGNLIYHIHHKPHMSLLTPKQLAHICNADKAFRDESSMSHYFRRLTYLIDVIIEKTLRERTNEEQRRTPASLARYVAWMEQIMEQQKLRPVTDNGDASEETLDDERIESLFQEVEGLYPPWQMFPTIARNLRGILCGKVDPLELVFSTGLAESIYTEQFNGICDQRLNRLLDLMSHDNPNLKILEVGAGTGRFTKHILDCLLRQEEQSGSTTFLEYVYTDLSPAFFECAAQDFLDDRVKFRVLDLEHDLIEQGVHADAYDLVIAGSVLHATRNLEKTLTNIHKTLKPEGKLLFLEMVAAEKHITNFGFGVFPGWWLCEEKARDSGPAINEDTWDCILKDSGYSGVDLCFRDYEGDTPHLISIMVSTAAAFTHQCQNGAPKRNLFLIVNGESRNQRQLAIEIKVQASKQTLWECKVLSISQLAEGDQLNALDVVVSLLETDDAILPDMSPSVFRSLQGAMKKIQNLLWVTATCKMSSKYPECSLATGFMRSMRLQAFEAKIVTLAIETDSASPTASTMDVLQVLDKSFGGSSTELEFIQRQGLMMSARLTMNKTLSATALSHYFPQTRHEVWQPGPALKLSMKTPGLLDTFQFVDDETFSQNSLGPFEVEFEAKAWGLSFRDLFIALGRLEESQLGYDCAGVVTRVGSACQDRFRPGERVFAGVLDCMRTFPRAHADLVGKVPDTVSLETYASIISPGVTAYYSLITVARLRRGERILIHSAAGGTGQMAICVAKMIGAEIYATVSNEEKKQLLIDRFGIRPEHVFYSRNTSFSHGVMRITDGQGMDVILNSLAGDGLRASWECMAPYGRFIEIGKTDIMADSALPMSGFKKNVSFVAVDIFHLASSDPALAAELIAKVIDLIQAQSIQPPSPLHLYPVSKIEDAFRFFQSGRNTGWIVVTVGHHDVVPKHLFCKPTWHFDPCASYIIAGGFGGLGRAVLSWMASRGAKNIIVPSRSGSSSTAAKKTILALIGVNIYAPICDVGDAEITSTMLKECAQLMPPIKGCINAAMVLQHEKDAVFQNMTPAQWELTIRSKVSTSWNLHRLLPQTLDFFILFSSLSGIYGTVAQSNYSAGCTFQDALARYRVRQGQKAVSLDIGWMRNIGIIAETEDYQRRREAEANMAQVEDKELLALLEVYCDPNCSLVTSEDKAQVLLGAVTPAMLRSHGQDIPISVERPLLAGFSQLRGEYRSTEGDNESQLIRGADAATTFRNAASSDEREEVVVNALKAKLAKALFTSHDDIETGKTLPDYGVDSLLAVELRNWIRKDFHSNVAVFDIMGGATIGRVGTLVVERSEFSVTSK
ncbi:hypothetical protein F4808DRAFT_469860 [Astrocystis sublimbata]|nr:hypothetical protein F4808DRAFT_469860 [Astrocystis sublimbata]